MMEVKKILKPKDLEALFGLNPRTMANLRWKGRGPKYYRSPSGRSIHYKYDEVAAWMLSRPVLTVDSFRDETAA